MADELIVDVRKRHAGGPEIAAALRLPLGTHAVTVLFGPSGAGKTTVLRMIAGLDTPDSGSIRCGGEVWYDGARAANLAPQHRRVGYLSQDYAIFPHLTVRGNVSYGARGLAVEGLLKPFDLSELADRYPRQLSGGELQRVALARALAAQPQCVLYDEPTTMVDPIMSDHLGDLMLRLKRQLKLTSVVVTHDLDLMYKVADRVVFLYEGGVIFFGTVGELEKSDHPHIREFLELDRVVRV